MARQRFFHIPEVRTESKYGAFTPDTSLTIKLKVIILLTALIGGAALGLAYSYIAAPDLNRIARERLQPGANTKLREHARKLAARRVEMQAQWAAEAEATIRKEIAEKLAQVNPFPILLGDPSDETTDSEDLAWPRRPAGGTRILQKPDRAKSLDDVKEEARRMLERSRRN